MATNLNTFSSISSYNRHPSEVIAELGGEKLLQALESMLLIRNFEVRAESAYQQGRIGGFFHSYIGQEAIQTAATLAFGPNNWYATSYRCHALALLLKATPNELMAELYGRETGNAKGRGGSMHFFTDRLLGGHGIVGGQIPIATGAAFTLKYLNKNDEISVCFLGDGAVAQGSFHESLNLASLWNLPCVYIIENNQWGMGTAVNRAIAGTRMAEEKAHAYQISGYTVDGMDFFACYALFKHIHAEISFNKRPILIEALTERFKGHSISDPALYRSKEDLKISMTRDPLLMLKEALLGANLLSEEEYKKLDKECKEKIIAAMEYADNSPWPDATSLEQDVFAP